MFKLKYQLIFLLFGMLASTSCGDDSTPDIEAVTAAFATTSLSVSEDANARTITIDFASGLPIASSLEVTISGTATYGEDFTTSPDGASNSLSITIPAAETSSSFSFIPIDNNDEDGSRTVIFTLSSPAEGIELGSSTEFTVTITDDDSSTGTASNDISVVASKFYHSDVVSVTFDDEWLTISSTNEPDHKSMYYDTSNPLYETYDEPDNPDFKQNPNNIESQNYTFKIPRYPTEATTKEETPFGPMGVSINGVVFYNQSAAPGDDILEELNTFDQYEGHPSGGGQYHYHIEPTWLTETQGDDVFLGFLTDGFPVYGPVEDGQTLTNDDLDDYHGHAHATADFPEGIYHYHITAELPWINGDGFFGTAGTLTN